MSELSNKDDKRDKDFKMYNVELSHITCKIDEKTSEDELRDYVNFQKKVKEIMHWLHLLHE